MKEIMYTAVNPTASINTEPPHAMTPGIELVIVTSEVSHRIEKAADGKLELFRFENPETHRFWIPLSKLVALGADLVQRAEQCAPMFESAAENYVYRKGARALPVPLPTPPKTDLP